MEQPSPESELAVCSRCPGRIRTRRAQSAIGYRFTVSLFMEGFSVCRGGDGKAPLHLVGCRATGRPCHPKHRRLSPAGAQRHESAHLAPRCSLPVRRLRTLWNLRQECGITPYKKGSQPVHSREAERNSLPPPRIWRFGLYARTRSEGRRGRTQRCSNRTLDRSCKTECQRSG